MAKQKRKNKERSGGGLVFGVLAFLVIIAAVVFAVSVFFRVSVIEVTGATMYTEQEIIAASGVKEGDNLILLNGGAVAARLRGELIYIGGVDVQKVLPNKVVIAVEEEGDSAVVETESGLWLIDKSGRLLSECSLADADNYIKVIGFSALSPKAGDKLTVAEGYDARVDYLVEILSALKLQNMDNDVSVIDVSNSANAQFKYLGRFTVKLGAKANTEYKLGLLRSAAAELAENETGTFDLSEDKKAYFSPD